MTDIDRYPSDWATRSRDTKRSRSNGNQVQCSNCGGWFRWDQVEVHHAYYKGEGDRAGVNVFPVCGSKQDVGTCHHELHRKQNWKQYQNIWKNTNTRSIIDKLRRGYATGNPDQSIPWSGIIGTIALITIGWALMSAILAKPKPTAPKTATIAPPGKYNAANLRSQPQPTAKKVGDALPKGATVTTVGRSVGWVEVTVRDGRSGWVAENFVK